MPLVITIFRLRRRLDQQLVSKVRSLPGCSFLTALRNRRWPATREPINRTNNLSIRPESTGPQKAGAGFGSGLQ